MRGYWKQLSAVGVGCLSMFIFDMCERGVQLRNPFYSIWSSEIGTQIAVSHHLCNLRLFSLNFSLYFFLTAELRHSGRNFRWCLFPVSVLHYLPSLPQHQRQASGLAGHGFGPSTLLRRRHLPIQVLNVGHPSLRCHDSHWIHFGPSV